MVLFIILEILILEKGDFLCFIDMIESFLESEFTELLELVKIGNNHE